MSKLKNIKTFFALKHSKRIVNAICITILALVLENWIVYDISSLSYFSQDKSADFELSDFYDQASHNSGEQHLDPNIVIVGIDDYDHNGIGEILDAVNYCEPKAIGLDVTFLEISADDSILCQALINASDKLIYPINENIVTGQRFPMKSDLFINSDILIGAQPANVSFTSTSGREVIRTFFSNTNATPTLAVALAKKTNPDAAALLYHRGNFTEHICYAQKEFYTICSNEIIEGYYQPERIKDKIVLIGTLYDEDDMHVTPINESMCGVKVHAYILSTILNQDYRVSLPNWITSLLSILFIILIINLCYVTSSKSYGNLISRIVPVMIIIFSLYIGYGYYVKYHWYVNIAKILLSVATAMLAFDLWTGIPGIFIPLIKIFKKKMRFMNRKLVIINRNLHSMLRLFFSLCFIIISFHASKAASYEVYRIQGKVINVTEGKELLNHDFISSSTKLEISAKGSIQFIDPINNRIYKYNKPGIAEVKEIINEIKKLSESNIRTVNSQVVHAANEDKEQATMNYRRGLSVRGENDTETMDVYLGLQPLLSSPNKVKAESETLVLSALFVDSESFYFAVSNLSEKPLYINIVSITQNGDTSLCLDLSNQEGEPYLLLRPGVNAHLNDYVFMRTEVPIKYILFASETPFDSTELNNLMHSKKNIISSPDTVELKTTSIIL